MEDHGSHPHAVLQGKISPVFIRSIERAQERRIVTLAWVEVVEEARLPPRQVDEDWGVRRSRTQHTPLPQRGTADNIEAL